VNRAVPHEYGRPGSGRCRRVDAGEVRCRLGRGHVDDDDRGADGHREALAYEQLADDAGERAGQLDDGLRGLDLDDRLVLGHRVARANQPPQDVGLGQTLADVRQFELLQRSHSRVPFVVRRI
jgi:hypothetical protein